VTGDAFPLVPDVDDNLIGTQKEPELTDRARARGAVLLVPAIWAALDRPSSLPPVPPVIRHCNPTATFTSNGVRVDDDRYVLDGDLTLKGVTRPVSLDLEFYGVNPGAGHGEVAGFEASVVVNRNDFGIDINVPLETGGVMVGEKVTITIEIEALKQA
jgi:hypothetical protein